MGRIGLAVMALGGVVLGACGDARGGPDASPVEGRLTFDAAMISWDDAGAPRPDGGVRPIDAGPRDAGRRDAGPRDAGRTCTGVATSCSLISWTRCSSQSGCYLGGRCAGYATSCYSQYSSYSCTSQQGCYWSSFSENCSGSARSCSLFSGSGSCVGQDGCRWEDECEGLAYSCSLLSELECESQQGCYLR